MLINLRNALMAGKRLPYDAEVEYLESTGTQYVDTGYSFNSATDSVELVFELLTTTPNFKWIFGAYDASKRLAIGSGDGVNRRTLGYNASTSYNSSTYYTDSAHIFLADSAGASIDGHNFFAFADFSTTSHIILYSIPIDLSTYCANARIWSYKHYRNGVLVRDYIPVRVGTVGYMYDRVSGKLFGNAGTGDFVLGPDVVPVEYIESHGTEYIDVGPIVGADEVIVKLSASSIPSSGCYKAFGVGYTSNFSDDFGINSSGWCGQSYAPVSLDTQSTARMSQSGRFIDDKNLGGSSSLFFTKVAAGNRLFLFCGTNGSSAYITGSGNYMAWRGRFYSCVVSSSGNKMFDHLPVRVGTEGAMMDVLTHHIYRNAGTGAFTYGNDLKYPIPA